MDYKEFNDYELIYQIKESDETAYSTLLDKYKPLVNKLASEYLSKNKNIGIDFDDLYQEGIYALSVALKDYNQDISLFYTYVNICIKREMEKFIKYNRRYKHMVLNDAISLDIAINNEEDTFLKEFIPSKEKVEDMVEFNDLYQKVLLHKYNLKFPESLILELKINQFSNKEISELLDIPYKKVDNCLKKIRLSLTKSNILKN